MNRSYIWLLVLALGCGDDDTSPVDAGGDALVDAPVDVAPDVVVLPELPGCEGFGGGATSLAERLEAGAVRAGQMTSPDESIGGDSAAGRIGDFKIYNDRVAFVIRDARLGDGYIPYGGGIIDGDLVRAPGEWGEDRIDELHTTFYLRPFEAEAVCVVSDGSDGSPAIIRSVGFDSPLPLAESFGLSGRSYGIRASQDFILAPDADAIEVVTTAVMSRNRELVVGDFTMLSDDGFDPFALGAGFDRDRIGALESQVMLGSAGEDQHLAYGLFAPQPWTPDDAVGPLLSELGGSDMTLYFPSTSVSFVAAEPVTIRRFVAIGRDVDDLVRARAQALEEPTLRTITGTVNDGAGPVAGARVHVLDPSTDPPSYVSMALTDEAGAYEVAVPDASLRLIATANAIGQDVEIPLKPLPDGRVFARGYHRSAPVEVSASATTADLTLVTPGHLRVRLVDDATDAPLAGKVLLFPETVAPLDRALGERRPFADVSQISWTVSGVLEIDAPPGTYRVVGGRGIEWEFASVDLTLVAGETEELELRLVHSVDTTGWIAGDMHTHAGPSIHGEATREMRVVTAIAEDLEMFVSTDHDRVVDYGVTADRLGLGDRIATVIGNEISSVAELHANAYPLRVVPEEPNGGATPWWENLSACEQFSDARAHGARLVQINHGTGRNGYFDNHDFDWLTGTHDDDYCSDFDVMETINASLEEELLLRYVGLLNSGHRVIPTGVSDSHTRVPEIGMARTYFRSDATASDLTDDEFVRAMQSGATMPTMGPFLELTVRDSVSDAGPGEVLTTSDAMVTVSVRVQAPSWIPIETVSLYTNADCPNMAGECDPLFVWGVDDALLPIGAVWLETEMTLPIEGIDWLFIRADSTADMSPVYPGRHAFGHTSAVFVGR